MKALSKITPEWYTPEIEKNETEPTRFHIKGLSGSEFVEVMPFLVFTKDGYNITSEAVRPLIKYGLLDWENFPDQEENPLVFSQANKFVFVPADIQYELARKIYHLTQITGEDTKKS